MSSARKIILRCVLVIFLVKESQTVPCSKVIEKIEKDVIILKKTVGLEFVDKTVESSLLKKLKLTEATVNCLNVTLTDDSTLCRFKDSGYIKKEQIRAISFDEVSICGFSNDLKYSNSHRHSIRKRSTETAEICGDSQFDPRVNSLVAGGEVFKAGVWPWMTALYCHLKFYCGGSIITDKLILTAAHCVQDKFEVKARQASHCSTVVGKHFLNSEFEDDYIVSSLRQFVVHPAWNPNRNNYDGDIAIAVLETPITFQRNIKPICLPPTKDTSIDLIGKSGVVAGWGYIDKRKTTTGLPRIVDLPIIKEDSCVESDPVFDTIMSHRSYCSASNTGKSPCKGDSGSGLCFKENAVWVIRGIVSVAPSDTCDGNSSVVFTDVAQFKPWIQNVIEQNIPTTTTSTTTVAPSPLIPPIEPKNDDEVPDITRKQVDKFFTNLGQKIKDQIKKI